MAGWLDAFVPVFGLLLLGVVLRRRLLRDDAVWAGMERLVFWVLLPALLVNALSTVNLATLPVGGMAAAIWLALGLGTALSVVLARLLEHGHPAMTSVLQGGIRFNNLMGFAIAGPVWGAEGLALAAVATGLIVPCVQVLVTTAFALDGRRVRPLAVIRQVALNPLLLGCAIGFAASALGGLPAGVGPTVRALGQATIALGLLCVGAALTPAGLRAGLGTQGATAVLKLLVMPAMVYGLCQILGLPPLPTAIATILIALPTATTAYVMARAMGGDAPLMAAITTSQHVLAVATLPLWVLFLTRG